MLGPHSLGVSLTSNHETVQSPKAPQHSSICIEDPSHTQITLPPLELTFPLLMHWRSLTLQALMCNASYLCFFRFLACLSQGCAFTSKLHVVSHNTIISPRLFIMHMHSLMSCENFQTRSVAIFIIIYFLYVGLHNWVTCGPSLHSHGSTNAPMVALEVSLHVIRSMHRYCRSRSSVFSQLFASMLVFLHDLFACLFVCLLACSFTCFTFICASAIAFLYCLFHLLVG